MSKKKKKSGGERLAIEENVKNLRERERERSIVTDVISCNNHSSQAKKNKKQTNKQKNQLFKYI